jgi:cbb3-type cytochrome oxidase maturation protein
MIDNWVLALTLIVSLILGFVILGTFVWGAKTGQFDDEAKVMNGLLFDSEEDLQDAVKREEQTKELIKNKKAKMKSKESRELA